MTCRLVVIGLLSLVIACGAEPGPSDVASKPGDGDPESDECSNDKFEPNEVPEAAKLISWDEPPSGDGGNQDADVVIDGFLCSGEHDWYRVPIEQLGFEYNVVRVDGLVRGSSWCAQFESCGGETLASAPENTLAVEIYDAASMVLLGADIATDGRVDVDGWGPNYSHDLLIYVYGPSTAATYAYELYVDVRSYDGEDECEC
jgi:hypothetical protein